MKTEKKNKKRKPIKKTKTENFAAITREFEGDLCLNPSQKAFLKSNKCNTEKSKQPSKLHMSRSMYLCFIVFTNYYVQLIDLIFAGFLHGEIVARKCMSCKKRDHARKYEHMGTLCDGVTL